MPFPWAVMRLEALSFNGLLLKVSGGVAVAAFGATNSLFSIVSAVSIGIFNSSSTLVSFLHGEEDRDGIIKTFKISTRLAVILFSVVCGLMLLFPRVWARGLLDAAAVEQLDMAHVFIRYMAVMYILYALTYPQSGVYQGIGRQRLIYVFTGLRECVMPIVCTTVLGAFLGVQGFEFGLVLSGIIMLICCFAIPSAINKRPSFSLQDRALLPADFGPKEDELFESSIHSMEDVVKASEESVKFCGSRGADTRKAYYTGLFVEEMAGNSIVYGKRNGRNVDVDVRIICRDDKLTIRIRIITALAKDVQYIPAMGLNNLQMNL